MRTINWIERYRAMMRKDVLSLLAVSTLFVFSGNAKAQDAVQSAAQKIDIRYYVVQSSGLFEVIDNSKPAALFNKKASNETIGGQRVVGYTDRASRKEKILVYVKGEGMVEEIGVEFNGRKAFSLKKQNLPFLIPQKVSPDSDKDNITSFVTQGGKTTRRRLPVGTR
jgi:hypothetical protein